MRPDKEISEIDKGGETLKRYRFQITYAAIISLSMLDDNSQAHEIFCEHFEDILVKLKDGNFVGVQVKTRDLNLGPFEATDQAIEKTIKRFIELDLRYNGQFSHFSIATNVGFAKSNNYKDLSYLIKLAKDGNLEELLKDRSKFKSWIKKRVTETKSSEDIVIKTLTKINLKADVSGLDSIYPDLVNRLNKYEILKDQTYGVLEGIADNLFLMHFDASSLKHESQLDEYFILSKTPEKDEIKEKINGKKITLEAINNIIEQAIKYPVSLFLINRPELGKMPKGVRKLEIKMDKGGITYDNIVLQKDYKYSSEKHMASWIYKYNKEKVNNQYNQVKLIVNTECQEVYDKHYTEKELFGQKMLNDVRTRLRQRHNNERNSFFDCKYEHLLGMAGILTEECKIWWSSKFKI